MKLIERGRTSVFIVKKKLRQTKVKFLIEEVKKQFQYCIITLYIEQTPDTNISDTFNELKQFLAHSCFYISGKAKTYIKKVLPYMLRSRETHFNSSKRT